MYVRLLRLFLGFWIVGSHSLSAVGYGVPILVVGHAPLASSEPPQNRVNRRFLLSNLRVDSGR